MVIVLAILTILALTLNPAFGKTDQPRLSNATQHHRAIRNRPGALSHSQAVVIKSLMCAYAFKYDTKPEYVMAVGHVESRSRGFEFRTSKTGRYYQPMGIHECFLEDRGWPVDTLDGNIEVGARALSGIQTLEALKRRLKKYNCEFNQGYWHEILKAIAKYQDKGI